MESALIGQDLLGVLRVEPGMGHDGIRKPVSCVHLGEPKRLFDLARAVHLRFAMHRREHIMQSRIVQIVFRRVVASELAVIAEKEMRVGTATEPRIVMATKIP